MLFPKPFFDLQVTFAERVRAICALPLDRALLEYTNLYVRFGLGRDFDPDHSGWRTYAAGLNTTNDPRDWTYRFYQNDPETNTAPTVAAAFGCFSYGLLPGGTVRLHFRSSAASGRSPIGSGRDAERRADLAALCAHIRTTAVPGAVVAGGSWLYNLDAYRRLFPPVYVESLRAVYGRCRSMSLWGQFLDHRGQLKRSMVEPFLLALERCSTMDGLERCFPFQVLATQAQVEQFCAFYDV